MSSDIDVLVSSRERWRAWQVCRASGYRSLEWKCPMWLLDQHRIHWRLQREGEPVVCELHWAVEPVYGVMTFDYEALVREAAPSQMFLLLCLHVWTHVSDACQGAGPDMPALDEVVQRGMLFRWLDVAMFLRRYGARLDWQAIDRQARDRRLAASLVFCLAGVRDWFQVPIPEAAAQWFSGWEASVVQQRSTGMRKHLETWWVRRVRRVVGVETALADVLYFLWPHALYFGPAKGVKLNVKREWHFLKAATVLVFAGLRYVCFVGVTSLRNVGGALRCGDHFPVKLGAHS
jgi:hypothetical protein